MSYKKILFTLSIVASLLVGGAVLASTTDGTIGPGDSLACTAANAAANHCTALLIRDPATSADDAYINFGRYSDPSTSTAAAVHVTSSELTGFAFGETVGWINLNCDANHGANCVASGHFKVANDGNGNLSGYAWGETTGWVSFWCGNETVNNCASNGNFRVTIDSNGNFGGYAWSQNFGYFKFDCSSGGQAAGACVNTDWRAGGTSTTGTTGTTGTAGSGTGGTAPPPPPTGTSGTSSGTTATTTTGTTATSSTTGTTAASTSGTTGTSGSTSGTSGTTTTGGSSGGPGGFASTGTTATSSTTGTTAASTSGTTASPATSGTGSSSGTSGATGSGIIHGILSFFGGNGSLLTPQAGTITAASRVISTVGAAIGTALTLVAAVSMMVTSFSLADLLSVPLRLWSLLLAFLGARKKRWGVVYDSVTKQPLDPVYVTLKDAAGNDVGTSITDLDGRYGFLTKPGTYTITAGKTNYEFPSKKLAGKTADELYRDLYFGEPITLTGNEIIAKNIPMDPIKFDWNEFAKREQKLMNFYSKRAKTLSEIARVFFYIGFVFSIIAMYYDPTIYNKVVLSLYVAIEIIQVFGLKQKSWGGVVEKATGYALPFSIVRIFSPATNIEITHKVVDINGKYYCLVSNGTYYATVDKKNLDGSYTRVLTTAPFEVKGGIIDTLFEV